LYLRPEPQWHGWSRDSFGSGFWITRRL